SLLERHFLGLSGEREPLGPERHRAATDQDRQALLAGGIARDPGHVVAQRVEPLAVQARGTRLTRGGAGEDGGADLDDRPAAASEQIARIVALGHLVRVRATLMVTNRTPRSERPYAPGSPRQYGRTEGEPHE